MKNFILFLVVCFVFGCESAQYSSRDPAGKISKGHLQNVDDQSVSSLNGLRVNRLAPFFESEFSLDFYTLNDEIFAPQKFEIKTSDELKAFGLELIKIYQHESNSTGSESSDVLKVSFAKKGSLIALAEMIRLTKFLQNFDTDKDKFDARVHLIEIAAALRNNFRYPTEKKIKAHEAIGHYLLPYHVKANEDHPATNVEPNKTDPQESTFWKNPGDISQKDLYYGFGRSSLPHLDKEKCKYKGPKNSYGVHPGFHIDCDGVEYKVKFGGEVYSGPFNTRLFWAMGYNTEPIDAWPEPIIKYDRDIFREFNTRKQFGMKFTLMGVKVYQAHEQKYQDPFKFVQKVILKDGTSITVDQFKNRILKNPAPATGRSYEALIESAPETKEDNYIATAEGEIAFVVFAPASIAVKTDSYEIGEFDYSTSDHPDRRELRGAYMVSAWVGNNDMHWLNTKLAILPTGQLLHVLADVGSSFEKYAWEYTKSTKTSSGRNVEIKLRTYESGNQSFDRMTFDDAKWMLNYMAQISENQLSQALIATAMSAAEARLTLEKLVSIRNQMILDFDLKDKLGSAIRKVNKKLKFDFSKNQFTAKLADGTEVSALPKAKSLVNGNLK